MTARDGQGGKLVQPEPTAPPEPTEATLADVLDLEARQVEAGTPACGYHHGCHGDIPCVRITNHETHSVRSADMHAHRTEAGEWLLFGHCEDEQACDERRAAAAAEQARAEQEAAEVKAAEHAAIGKAVLDALLANPEPLAKALHPHLARLDKTSDH